MAGIDDRPLPKSSAKPARDDSKKKHSEKDPHKLKVKDKGLRKEKDKGDKGDNKGEKGDKGEKIKLKIAGGSEGQSLPAASSHKGSSHKILKGLFSGQVQSEKDKEDSKKPSRNIFSDAAPKVESRRPKAKSKDKPRDKGRGRDRDKDSEDREDNAGEISSPIFPKMHGEKLLKKEEGSIADESEDEEERQVECTDSALEGTLTDCHGSRDPVRAELQMDLGAVSRSEGTLSPPEEASEQATRLGSIDSDSEGEAAESETSEMENEGEHEDLEGDDAAQGKGWMATGRFAEAADEASQENVADGEEDLEEEAARKLPSSSSQAQDSEMSEDGVLQEEGQGDSRDGTMLVAAELVGTTSEDEALRNRVESLEEEVDEARRALQDRLSEVSSLQEENASLEEQVNRLCRDKEEEGSRVRELEREKEGLLEDLRVATQEREVLNQKLEDANAEVEARVTALLAVELSNAAPEKEIAKKDSEIAQLKQQLSATKASRDAELQDITDELEAEVEDLRDALEKLQGKNAEEIESLRSKLADQSRRHVEETEDLRRDLTAAKAQVEGLKKELEEGNAKHRAETEVLQKQMARTMAHVLDHEEDEGKLQKIIAEKGRLEEENKELKAAVEKLSRETRESVGSGMGSGGDGSSENSSLWSWPTFGGNSETVSLVAQVEVLKKEKAALMEQMKREAVSAAMEYSMLVGEKRALELQLSSVQL